MNIEFWFSIGSTYTYLSVNRIFDVEKKHKGINVFILEKGMSGFDVGA